MKQVHIPNLFMLVGQDGQGKTTLGQWFNRVLSCCVIHVDLVYLDWIQQHIPKYYQTARADNYNQYEKMPPAEQQAWNEYLTDYIIATAAAQPLFIVAEGRLLSQLPAANKRKLARHVTNMTVQVRHFQAYIGKKSFRAASRDYTTVVKSLIEFFSFYTGSALMEERVRYQAFEDIREYRGISDSQGKWLALKLPVTLTGKQILDVGCGTGYFSIRCWQRGAAVEGIDIRKKHVELADRIAHAFYQTNDVCFYRQNFLTMPTDKKYDYVLAVTVLPYFGNKLNDFFAKAYKLLKPGGTLVIETALTATQETINKKTGVALTYVNKPTLLAAAKGFELTYYGRSIHTRSKRSRRVLHFRRLGDDDETNTCAEHVLHLRQASARQEHDNALFQDNRRHNGCQY